MAITLQFSMRFSPFFEIHSRPVARLCKSAAFVLNTLCAIGNHQATMCYMVT
jgi:hypothetical protein